MAKVGVSQEEKNLSYYKYFEQDLAPIPEEKIAIWQGPPAAPETGLPVELRNEFLKGNHEGYCTVGYGVTESGNGFVCNTTYMPGVTTEMMDWWFPWHSVGSDLRYKIWDPEDHYFATAYPASYVCDPSVPMNQKTWGVDHYIIEDIGTGPDALKLCFKNPADLGYDPALIGTDQCESLVCAIGEGSCPALMTHKWCTYEDGIMFESRFWIGYGMVDGEVKSILPPDVSIPPIVPKALFGHNIKEFTNLAAILPSVYAEQKDVF